MQIKRRKKETGMSIRCAIFLAIVLMTSQIPIIIGGKEEEDGENGK